MNLGELRGQDDIEVIDAGFVADPRQSVVAYSVGTEMVLVDRNTGIVHALNPVASTVWQCFDGDASLAEIVADLADVFQVAPATVEADVISMARTAARSGLLKGFDLVNADEGARNAGVEQGEIVYLPILKNPPGVSRKLLVNWSAGCGFCVGILPQLAALQPSLKQTGTRIVLVDQRTTDDSRRLAAEHGLDAEIIDVRILTISGVDAFGGMGTPVAYLIDEEDRVVSGLAYGVGPVLALARTESEFGLSEGEGNVAVPEFLPVSGGVCGPGPSKRSGSFEAARAFDVGSFRVGIRASSRWAESVVSSVLARYLAPTPATAPNNFSVTLFDGAVPGRRDLNVLQAGTLVVARSRSPRRVLMALAGHLSCLLEPDPVLRRLDAIGAVVDGHAVLLPKSTLTRQLGRLQPSLARMGVALLDEPFAHIDLDASELVVNGPIINLDEEVLDALADPLPGQSEPAPVAPGRYPLRAWMIPTSAGTVSPAAALTAALTLVVQKVEEVAADIGAFACLLEQVEVLPVISDDADSILRSLRAVTLTSSSS